MKTDTRIRYVGLDGHQDSISVAIAEDGPQGEVRHFGSITADLHRLDQLLCKLRKDGATLKFAYEAGPGGFVICRRLRKLGIDCLVAAPSLIPLKAGDRVKTDRRDAIKLARLLRMGELTGVHVPEPDDEAIRDVCRSRCDAVCAARRCRQQLGALLLRHGYRVPRVPWSEGHVRHLRETALAHPALKIALEEYIQAVEAAKDRVARLETHMQALLESWGMRPFVEALMALRGVDWITAMVLVAELGDIRRFTRPKQQGPWMEMSFIRAELIG